MLLPAAGTALPAITTLRDCADFSKTVAPFLPQLYTLPYDVAAHITDIEQLKAIYLATNPAVTGLAFALFLSPIFFLVSEFTRNYSQVDRMWSILPLIYNAHFSLWAHLVGQSTIRLDHILAFTTIWSLRLTYNFFRKGGYSSGHQDYRWPIIQDYLGPAAMFVFNVTFVATMQSVILYAITTPSYILLLVSRLKGPEMETSDSVFARSLMILYLIEFFADQQQWHFQQAKKTYLRTAKVPAKFEREDLDRGFVASGLWAYSRHPNFAAEQGIWLTMYLWCAYSTQTYFNWAAAGTVSLLLIFQGSTWLTELLSTGKYPEYKEYQRRVGRFVPPNVGNLLGFGRQDGRDKQKGQKTS